LTEQTLGEGEEGGLLVYVRNGLQVLKLDSNVSFCQMCRFQVKDVVMYLLYRPPSARPDSISEIASVISATGKKSIIIGDFNVPHIDWRLGEARGRASEILSAVEDTMMEQLVDFPTHLTGNTLDLVETRIFL
jgi:hypothetical protein